MKQIVKIVVAFVTIILIGWFIKLASTREGFSAHLSFSGDSDNYASQKLTKISRVNIDGSDVYSKASIDVSNIIAMTVIDNNTVYLIDFNQKAYRVSFLLPKNDFSSMNNNITSITLPNSQKVMKIVKSYHNDSNEVFFLSNQGKIYQDGSTRIGNTPEANIIFVDIATSAIATNKMMAVTREGRLLVINLDSGAITNIVSSGTVGGTVGTTAGTFSSYDRDPGDEGNIFLYTQVEGNKSSTSSHSFAAIRTSSDTETNSIVRFNSDITNIDIVNNSNDTLLESNIKLHFYDNKLYIYRSDGVRVLDFVTNSSATLFATTNTTTKAFTVSNTGIAYHFSNNDLFSKTDTDTRFNSFVFSNSNLNVNSASPDYVQMGAHGDNHIFLISENEITIPAPAPDTFIRRKISSAPAPITPSISDYETYLSNITFNWGNPNSKSAIVNNNPNVISPDVLYENEVNQESRDSMNLSVEVFKDMYEDPNRNKYGLYCKLKMGMLKTHGITSGSQFDTMKGQCRDEARVFGWV
jgi:hypothetical protein